MNGTRKLLCCLLTSSKSPSWQIADTTSWVHVVPEKKQLTWEKKRKEKKPTTNKQTNKETPKNKKKQKHTNQKKKKQQQQQQQIHFICFFTFYLLFDPCYYHLWKVTRPIEKKIKTFWCPLKTIYHFLSKQHHPFKLCMLELYKIFDADKIM